jgi:hypothetical protein
MLKGMAAGAANDPTPPDLSHPGMRMWLDALPSRSWPRRRLRDAHLVVAGQRGQGDPQAAGRRTATPPSTRGRNSSSKDKYGPLRAGELERASAWGAALAQAMVQRRRRPRFDVIVRDGGQSG